jgi:hypothetical protein
MTPQCERIAEKLERLKAADPKCLTFGVHIHRYRLGPALPVSELQSIETDLGIALPNDYGAFLRELGNGGAGPGYGLQRFGFVPTVAAIPTAVPRGPHRTVQQTRNGTLSRQDLFDRSGKKVDPFDVSLFESIKALAPDGSNGPEAPRRPFSLTKPYHAGDEDPSGPPSTPPKAA